MNHYTKLQMTADKNEGSFVRELQGQRIGGQLPFRMMMLWKIFNALPKSVRI